MSDQARLCQSIDAQFGPFCEAVAISSSCAACVVRYHVSTKGS